MGTRGTGFSVLTRWVLGSFKSLSTFLADTGCVYTHGCWEDGRGEDAIPKTKMSPDDLLPLDSLPKFLEVLAITFCGS